MTRPHQPSTTNAPTPTRPTQQRRGTILLMVVGVLALLSIITIVYVTLGRSDRVQSSAVVRTQRLNDQAGEVAEYLTRILARDMFSTYVEHDPSDPAGAKTITRRELWDYGSTDPQMRSTILRAPAGASSSIYLFNPEGSVPSDPPTPPILSNLSNLPIRRQPSDPFIAASEPSRIPIDVGANNLFPTVNDSDKWFRQLRDWAHISVISPSGNPVNLVNLRDNFNIPPGFGTDNAQPRYTGMSQRLGLFNQNGEMVTGENNSPPDEVMLRGEGRTLERPVEIPGGWNWDTNVQLNRPADWSNDQFTLFRPMVDSFDPGDPKHITNQFADADGDGFADSRWCELVDISFQGATTTPTFPGTKPVITQNNDVRLFVAARVIDLTGLVNVNTAGDFLDPPGDQVLIPPSTSVPYDKAAFLAAGASPADVDLRRLLMLTDITHQYRALGTGAGGYSFFPQPTSPSPNDPADYSLYGDNADDATLSGEGAFESLRLARLRLALPSTSTVPTLGTTPLDRAERVVGRFFAYEGVAAEPMGAARAGTNDLRIGSLFGLDDELELRTFAGLNDPGTTSRLERVMGGRGTSNKYSPLRDTRPAEIERSGRDVAMSARTLAAPAANTPAGLADRALFAAIQDVRSKLTTVSGARQFATNWTPPLPPPTTVPPLPPLPPALSTDDQPRSIPKLLKDFEIGSDELVGGTTVPLDLENAYSLFETYASALAPYLEDPSNLRTWPTLDAATGLRPAANVYDTLAYGASAEVALRAAAHMTVNFIDAVDHESAVGGAPDQHIPTALLMDFVDPGNQTPPTLPVELDSPSLKRLTQAAGAGVGTSPLTKLAPAIQRASNQNLVVFGIEAQPVLVEAASFSVFCDTPERSVVNGSTESVGGSIDIDSRIDPSNADYLFEILAFKLNNPSGETMTLSEGPNLSTYYFEYANRFFLLEPAPGAAATPIVLSPGETKVFYCISPDSEAAAVERINNALTGASWGTPSSITGPQFRDWITKQIGTDAVHIPLGRPDTMAQVSFPTLSGGFGGSTHQLVDLHGEVASPLTPALYGQLGTPRTRGVVNLWRQAILSPGETRTTNNPLNDYLVDRLRDPRGPGLSISTIGTTVAALLPVPSRAKTDVPSTNSGDESGPVANLEDNRGSTTVEYGAIRRPSDEDFFVPAGAPTRARRGMFPPYAIECKSDNFNVYPSQNGWERKDNFPGSGGTYTSTGGVSNTGWEELGQFWRATSATVPVILNETLAKKPIENVPTAAGGSPSTSPRTESSTTPPIDKVRSKKMLALAPTAAPTFKEYSDVAVEIRSLPSTGGGPAVKAMFSRASDMLSPLAIGPTLNPGAITWGSAPAVGDARADELEGAWLTLGEAMAMASDYYSPPAQRTFGVPNQKYLEFSEVTLSNFAREIPDKALANRVLPIARRGRLVLDDYVPFIDRALPSTNYREFQGKDETIGAGIPLALTLLDRFSPSLARLRNGTAELSSDIEGPESLGRLIPGLININTAPLAVLRLLPLLAPDPQVAPAGGGTFLKPWVQELPSLAPALGALPGGTAPTFTSLYDLGNPDDTFDIASTLLAYRDKSHVLTRPSLASGTAAVINLSGGSGRSNFTTTPPASANPRIQGLRQQRGFASVGEVLAANLRQEDLTFVAPTGNVAADRNNSIFRFGFDEARTEFDGLDPARFKTGTAAFGSSENGDTEAEATSIADAILKTITVRSDVFCVYFLIHGYTPEDVRVGKDPKIPMVPSLQRRYVMVVDRSNVTTSDIKAPAGQRVPRILMLRQVPER